MLTTTEQLKRQKELNRLKHSDPDRYKYEMNKHLKGEDFKELQLQINELAQRLRNSERLKAWVVEYERREADRVDKLKHEIEISREQLRIEAEQRMKEAQEKAKPGPEKEKAEPAPKKGRPAKGKNNE